MALSVVGERALWLNLKRRIAGALFGPAVALMQQRCDDKKKEDEALEPLFKRRRVSYGGVGHPPLEAAQPVCSVDVCVLPSCSGGLL